MIVYPTFVSFMQVLISTILSFNEFTFALYIYRRLFLPLSRSFIKRFLLAPIHNLTLVILYFILLSEHMIAILSHYTRT